MAYKNTTPLLRNKNADYIKRIHPAPGALSEALGVFRSRTDLVIQESDLCPETFSLKTSQIQKSLRSKWSKDHDAKHMVFFSIKILELGGKQVSQLAVAV